jgi:hypothetical protein
MPLVDDLGATENMVAIEAGGRQAGVVWNDADPGARVERLDAWT